MQRTRRQAKRAHSAGAGALAGPADAKRGADAVLHMLDQSAAGRGIRVTLVDAPTRGFQHSLGAHTHAGECQLELVAGAVRYTLGGQRGAVAGEALLLIPPGVAHSFVAARAGGAQHCTVRFVWAGARPGVLPPLCLRVPDPGFYRRVREQMRILVEEWHLRSWGHQTLQSLRVATILAEAVRAWREAHLQGPAGGVLEAACRFLAGHYCEPLTTSALARRFGLRPDSFCRLFRTHLHTTPGRYLRALRLRHAQALLRAGHSVTHCAGRVGFASIHHFSRAFRAAMGVSPRAWRDGDLGR